MGFTRVAADVLEGDVWAVARRLLGVRLVRATPEGVRSGFIVETEAYHQGDPASHCYSGVATPRTRSMFQRAGTAYVYMIYGNSSCMNVVCEAEGTGAGILLRALEPDRGQDLMARARGRDHNLTNGPGRLCQALGIDRSCDGLDLFASDALFLAEGREIPDDRVITTTRVGITQAQDHPWRYYVRDSRHVSRRETREARVAARGHDHAVG